MKNIQLRQFEEKDAQIIYQLHIEGLKQTDSFIDDPKARRELDQDLMNVQKTYIDNRGEFLVAVVDDKIIGMGGLRNIDSTTAEIKRMRVTPSFQGKGIGKLILDTLIENAQELGYKKLVLDTAAKQVAAQHLYELRGFKEYKRATPFGQETIYYERTI